MFGQLRTTLSPPGTRQQARQHIPLVGSADDAVYAQNIQTAELNALNSLLAVMRWKRARGFYTDLEHEVTSTYVIDGNTIINTTPTAASVTGNLTIASSGSVAEPTAGDTLATDGIDRGAAHDDGRSEA